MVTASPDAALYASRSGAGAQLGNQLTRRTTPPTVIVGITPTGVEVAVNAAKVMGCEFDVIVAAHVRMEAQGIIGAIAEDADAVLDKDFQPRFGMIDALNEAMERARRAIKTERLLFRGQRPLRKLEGSNVVIVEGHATSPWKALAAAQAIQPMLPARIFIGAPVGTQSVQDLVRARRYEFVCPTVVMDPSGHPMPFGDPQDPSAERLRSIVVARQAA